MQRRVRAKTAQEIETKAPDTFGHPKTGMTICTGGGTGTQTQGQNPPQGGGSKRPPQGGTTLQGGGPPGRHDTAGGTSKELKVPCAHTYIEAVVS